MFLDFNSWIFKIMLCSRVVMARFGYLECHCSLFRTVRSETCPWSVAILYLVVSSALELQSQLHLAVQQQPLMLWTLNFWSFYM